MTTIWIGIAVAVLFACSAWLSAWSRRNTWGRPAAIVLFALGLPAIAAAGVQSLGQHRPMSMAWEIAAGDHRVLATKMVQGVAIYLYLDTPERFAPWPLQLPWNNANAKRIQELQDSASSDAMGQFLFSYEPSLDVHPPQFHPLPQQPALPPKPEPERAPHYQQI
jgi:hypothetical protein